MDSLVGYGSDDDNDERYGGHTSSVGHGVGQRRRDDDTNYDDVNMDMSEDSQGAESEPELPQAEPAPSRHAPRRDERASDDSSERSRSRNRSRERRERRRESPPRARPERRDGRRDDRHARSERSERSRGHETGSRRGLLGDRPDERASDAKVPALMDLKPFGEGRSHDARDAASPRFVDRDRRERDRGERERDRDRHGRRSEEKRSQRPRSRSRSRGRPPASSSSSSSDRRGSPSGDYRPTSYKVNKKLEVMEKMGLQIKTPDGSMATARQLRAAADSRAPGLTAALHQVQKRKLLWQHKSKTEGEGASQWSAARFSHDSDGKQAHKFLRLMGIKDPAATTPTTTTTPAVDPLRKQEELFQAMQAQYDVARATTHTMRGVGLGFSRNHY